MIRSLISQRCYSQAIKKSYILASNVPTSASISSIQQLIDPENSKLSEIRPMRSVASNGLQRFLLATNNPLQSEGIVTQWNKEYQTSTGIILELYNDSQNTQISQISEVKVYMANLNPKTTQEEILELCRQVDEPLEIEFPLNSSGKNKGNLNF